MDRKPQIDVTGLTAVVKQQSTAYSIELEVPKDKLEEQFNLYWSEVRDVLPPNIVKVAQKGGFRKVSQARAVKAAGGKNSFYQPVLLDTVRTYLNTQPRQALAFNSVEMVETDKAYVVRAGIYLEPEVRWKKKPGIEEPLIVKIPQQPDNYVDMLVEQAIKQGQDDSVVLVPCVPDTTVVDNHVVVIDCVSMLNGDKWEPGCVENVKWPVEKKFYRQPELYDLIVGMKAGESRSTTFKLAEALGADAGKEITATIKLHQAYTKDVPAVDDDLAKNYGFQTLEAWKTAVTKNITEKRKTQRKQLIDMNVLSQLMNPEIVEVDPIPFVWMAEKSKQMYGNFRQKVKTEDALIEAFKGATTTAGEEVKDKNTLLTYLAEMAAKSLLQDVVLRSWGQLADVQGDRTFDGIVEYVKNVRQKLDEIVTIEEVPLPTNPVGQETTNATIPV